MSTASLVPLPIVLPLLGAAVTVVAGRWRAVQRAVSVTALAAMVVISILLLVEADRESHVVQVAGGWSAPLGIALVVDRLAGIMLVVSSVVLLVVMVYAVGQAGAEFDAGHRPPALGHRDGRDPRRRTDLEHLGTTSSVTDVGGHGVEQFVGVPETNRPHRS